MRPKRRAFIAMTIVVFSIVTLGFIVNGCQPNNAAVYEGSVTANIVNYDISDRTLVFSYFLGETRVIDKMRWVDDSHFWFIADYYKKNKPVEFNIKRTGSEGGG